MELFTGLLRDEVAGNAEALSHVARVERELGQLKTIVSDFLEYARRARPELAACDAAAILREVEPLLAAEAGAVKVRALVDAGPAGVAPVRGDPVQLKRVLVNLGRNAIQAAGGEVELACRVRPGEGRVELSVRDDGPGVPDDLREKIFTPFFTTREKGTGLGLAFVREIAVDHGGVVRLASRAGEGATFTVELPLDAAGARVPESV
jgi:signal transduction histidine kinase